MHRRSQEVTSDSTEKQQSNQDTAVDVPDGIIHKEIKNFLRNQNLLAGAEQNAEAERFLALVRTEAGLLVSRGTGETGEPLYGFVHRTFQEYFAAMDVWERYQQESDQTILSDFLVEHVHDPHWHEVILLLLGKLPRKVATTQLRRVLKGENRLSQYNDLVKQDLFFIGNCLADGITVERDFAQQIVSEISTLAKTSPFPSQTEEALSTLGRLLRTRQYAEMGRKALKALINDDASPDIELKIEAAGVLYHNSPIGSDEKREGFRLLKMLGQQEDLTCRATDAGGRGSSYYF